jgi:DNA-binding transcriptional regulator YiaG
LYIGERTVKISGGSDGSMARIVFFRAFNMKPGSIDEHVGRRLRLLRQSRHMSIVRLAEIVGVSSAQIEKYERGAERISAVDLR